MNMKTFVVIIFAMAFAPVSDAFGQATSPDINKDGIVDVNDVDLLTLRGNLMTDEVLAKQDDPMNFNDDIFINHKDLTIWLRLAFAGPFPKGGTYLRGDANLDGIVDDVDFDLYLEPNLFHIALDHRWSNGDFNGDGAVDGLDCDLWAANHHDNPDPQGHPDEGIDGPNGESPGGPGPGGPGPG